MSQAAPIIFLDTETLGLSVSDPIWEIALIRREEDGAETSHQWLVQHDPGDCLATLPKEFADDYAKRDDPALACPTSWLLPVLQHMFRPGDSGNKPHVVGAVPNFDTERIAHQIGTLRWHYHLIDVENLAAGFLAGQQAEANRRDKTVSAEHRSPRLYSMPWSSDDLSASVGVRPTRFARHTAMGDVLWSRAIFDAVFG